MASQQLEQAIQWEKDFGEANAAADGIEEFRTVNEKWFRERQGELPADLEIESFEADGVNAVSLKLGSSPGPVVLFVHGGGYILGDAADNYEMLGRILRLTGGRAIGVNYRLAPEHPFPAQKDDVCTVYRWLLNQGTSPGEIVIVGESAGGGIALGALARLRDEETPMPGASVLLSPLLDFGLTGETLESNAGIDPFVTKEVLGMMLEAALQGQDPLEASPLEADFTGLPNTLLQVGTSEAILDDSRRFAAKAEEAGVSVTIEEWPEMIHLWHGFGYLPEAIEATEKIAGYISEQAK